MATLFDDLAKHPPLDIAAILRQTFNGVYNAQGRKIGSYASLDDLCRGKWFLFKGETSPGNSAIYIKELSGRLAPVVSMCFNTNKAPAFATPAQKAEQEKLVKEHGGVTPLFDFPELPDLTLPALSLPDIGFPDLDKMTGSGPGQGVGKLALYGGLAALTLIVLTSRGSRR